MRRPAAHVVVAIFAALLLGGTAWGQQTYQWSNTSTSTAWFTAENWTPNVSSTQWATNDTAQFLNAGTATSSGINMGTAGGNFSIGAIEVTAERNRNLLIGNSSGITGTLTLNGVTAAGVANTVLRNASSSLLTLQNNATGTGKTMNLAFGNVTANRIDAVGSSSIIITSNIVGVGGGLTKTGDGLLALGGANTYTGTARVEAGVLQFNTAASIGGTVRNVQVVSGGTAAFGYALDQSTLNRVTTTSTGVVALATNSANSLNLSAFSTVSNISLGAVGGTTAAPVVYSGILTPRITTYQLGGGGGVLEVSSLLSGARSVTIDSNSTAAGTVIFSAANTYTGTTAVQSGTLLVNNTTGSGTGSGNVTVGNLTTLGGTGTIAGPISVNPGGAIRGGFAGGNAAQATGTLNVGNTTLVGAAGTASATLAVDLNGATNPTTAAGSNSLLALGSNTFNLNSAGGKYNIRLLNDNALTNASTYTINLATGSSGTYQRNGSAYNATTNPFTTDDFNLISGSGTWAFNNVSLTVSGTNLQLTFQVAPVPEPATVLAVGAAGLGLMTWVRRRRKVVTA